MPGSRALNAAAGIVAAIWWAGPLSLAWQDQGAPPPQTQPTDIATLVDDARQRLARAEAATGLADDLKAKVVEACRSAVTDLEAAAEWQRKAAEFDKLRQDAPALLESIQAELAQPPAELKPDLPPDASLQQLEQKLAEHEATLKAARDLVTTLEGERVTRGERRTKLPEQIAAAKAKLAELVKQQALPSAADEPPALAQARRDALLARRLALEAEVSTCEGEVASHDARGGLLTARRDKAARDVAQAEALVKAWQEVVNDRRRQEANEADIAARRAQRAAALQHPALKTVAEQNAALAKTRAELVAKLERVTTELEQASKLRDQLTTDFTTVRQKVGIAGLTHAMGQLLRQKREHLPDLRVRERAVAARRAELSTVQVELIELENTRTELSDLERLVTGTLAEVGPGVGQNERGEIEAAARELYQSRRGIVDGLISDYGTHLGKLADLDVAERQLVDEVRKLAAYIDERVLWIQSTTLPRWEDVSEASAAIGWLLDRRHWVATLRELWRSLLIGPEAFAVAVPALLALMLARPRLRLTIESVGAAAAKPTAQAYLPTLRVLLLGALLAAGWPLIVAFVGWRLAFLLDAPDFVKAAAAGLRTVAVLFITAELFRQTLRPGGLAESHFAWAGKRVFLLRRQLLWLMVAGLPTAFIVSTVEWTASSAWQNSLGRMAFVVGQVLLAVFAQRVLKAHGGVFTDAVTAADRLQRLRHLWHVLGVGLPVLLALMATFGYYYTALQLARRLLASVWLILALVVAGALALRWLLLSRRKLAMEQARQRRAAATAAAKEKGEPTPADELAVPQLDLSVIGTQTRNLLFSVGVIIGFFGLWFIWVDVLPALNILDSVELWATTETVAETTIGPDGNGLSRTLPKSVPITLADLALALLTAFLASIAAKNLPGLMEIAILQHLPLQAGERYAITTTTRYVIVILAIVFVAGELGVGWSNIQWLVAAMTVGLGFGLQEIFANFISGLIILFERPIRLGDVVTVGNVTGRVSQIRTRATTIIDWDWKELIVPNKEFVTGQVVNWTLSSQVLRLVIPVGIAYGSDTRKAKQVLVDLAAGNPRVLAEPGPKAFFIKFGDSSLDFELRVWVRNLDDWLLSRDELHQAIDDRFRQEGIEIAFPQRDIHVRSIQAKSPIAPAADHPAAALRPDTPGPAGRGAAPD